MLQTVSIAHLTKTNLAEISMHTVLTTVNFLFVVYDKENTQAPAVIMERTQISVSHCKSPERPVK